ncbi:MAG: hypothetical protein KGI98_17665, partial [Euryarchaeota archaeon]|nr:hypothetical protein [Euryarchaeota archaeon]
MVGFFGAVFDMGFNAGKNDQNLLSGKAGESLQQTTQDEQNTTLLGVNAAQAKGVVAGTAAYIMPGGAILHGIGDTKESAAARLFDVAVGSLVFIPAVGELAGVEAGGTLAKAGEVAASLPGRTLIGSGISAGGTALQGGSPSQIFEAGIVGGLLGAGAPYAIKGVSGTADMASKAAHPLLYTDTETVGGNFAGSMQDIGLTEPRGPVLNEAGEIQGRANQIGEGGRSYGTPRGTGPENISSAELGRNVPTETGASVSPTEEGNIGGRSGGTQRALINQSVEHFNEGLTASNAADYLAGRSALDVAARATGETETVSTLKGPFQSVKDLFGGGTPRGGEVAIGSDYGAPVKAPGTGETSEDLFRSLGETSKPYRSGESFFNQRGPSGPGGGGPSLEMDASSSYESAGERTA